MPWAQGVERSNRPAPTKENKPFICNAGFGTASAPVATYGVLGFLEARDSYKIDYSGVGLDPSPETICHS
jgi:hypothetical protein